MFFASSRSSPSHGGNLRQDALRHRWQQAGKAGTVRRDLKQYEEHGDQSRVQKGFRRKEHARAFDCQLDSSVRFCLSVLFFL